jgi:hypothetical protein
VTGIGGVFFKAKDPKALNAWYARHLGFKIEEWGGAILKWPEDKANDDGLTVWNLGQQDGTWFEPSKSTFMINYRIDDMAGMVQQLPAPASHLAGLNSTAGSSRGSSIPRSKV